MFLHRITKNYTGVENTVACPSCDGEFGKLAVIRGRDAIKIISSDRIVVK
jgi:hypothetical protein